MVRTAIWRCRLTGGLRSVDLVGHAQLTPPGNTPAIEAEFVESGCPRIAHPLVHAPIRSHHVGARLSHRAM
jgi:hypothetical protein